MCLHINKAKHPIVTEKSGKQYFKPIVATEDIEVYKLLIKIVCEDGEIIYCTPYQEYPVAFNDEGKWESEIFNTKAFKEYIKRPKSKFKKIIDNDPIGIKSKNGYHAFTKNLSYYDLEVNRLTAHFIFSLGGIYTSISPNKRIVATICRIFEAIIPKGSYVYYGKDGDIASNQLIIKLEIVD